MTSSSIQSQKSKKSEAEDYYLRAISTDSHFKSAAGLAQQSLVLQSRADRLEPLELCLLTADTRVSLDSLLL